jgi:hypothetical protein
VIADADTGRPPRLLQRAGQARGAVDVVVPDPLARRDIEPPPNRLAPATLAAIFRSRRQVVAGRIAALAARRQGTRAGSCAQVTCQLIAGGIQDAAQAAAAISLRGDTFTEHNIGSELPNRAILAEAILCDEAEKLLP